MKLPPGPAWTVTWPTRPSGLYSLKVQATDATDAVRVAAERPWPTAPGYDVAFDYTPSVWRLRHPYRWRSRHVQGPTFPDVVPGLAPFTPLPERA